MADGEPKDPGEDHIFTRVFAGVSHGYACSNGEIKKTTKIFKDNASNLQWLLKSSLTHSKTLLEQKIDYSIAGGV